MADVRILERGFRGLNEALAPELLPEGFLTQADHVVLEQGEIRLRPGLVSQLASALPTAAYVLGASSDGSGDYLLVAANTKIRRWTWGGSTTSLPTGQGSITVTESNVIAAQGFGLWWLTDGTNALRSCNGSAVSSMASLDAPAAPRVELAQSVLLTDLGGLTWTQNSITGTTAPTSILPYADRNINTSSWTFENGASSTAAPSPNNVTNTLDANRDECVEMDGKDERAISAPMVLPANADATGYARLAVIEFEAAGEDTSAPDVASEQIDALVRSYSDTGGTTEISGSVQRWRSPLLKESQATKLRYLWDGRSLSTVPRAIRMIVEQPFDRPSNIGVDANHAAIYIPKQELSLSSESGRLVVRQGSVQAWNTPDQPRVAGGTSVGTIGGDTAQSTGRLLTAGLQVRTALSPAQDWSGQETLALELAIGAGVTGLSLRVGLKSSGTIYWSQSLDTTLEEGWGLADLRDIQANLSAVDQVILELREDVLVENLQEAGNATVFTVGALRSPGNLATGRSYWYRLVEIDDEGDTAVLNTIESEGSAATIEAIPTYSKRRISLALPSKANAAATHLAIYRFGGGLIDDAPGALPTGRLVGILPFSASTFGYGAHTATGTSPHERAPANPYLAFDDTGDGTLIDNTPDSWLFGAETFRLGREKPPTAPISVAVWNQRVWLSTASEIFGSWLVDMQTPAALYWSRINLPEDQDPHAALKGFWVRLPLMSGDSIVRLWPRGNGLLIFCERGVWELSGRDQTSYRLEQISPYGLAAARGICEHRGELYWLTHDGLVKLSGRGVASVGEPVRRSLPPLSGATATAYAKSCLISTPDALLVCVPANSSASDPNTVLVLGVRSEAWTKWPGLALAGGAIRPESPVCAVGTLAGQICLLTGSADGTGTTDINPVVTTRPLGSREHSLKPHHLSIDATLSANESLTLTVTGDDSGEAAAKTYQFNPRVAARFRVSRAPEGRSLTLSVSAATRDTFRLRRLGIEAVPFTRRN